MSKWNRPMRRYELPVMVCDECGERLVRRDAGWHHKSPVGIRDPRWHLPKPIAP